MERDAAAGLGARRWEASPDGVIVLPAGSAAPQHARHQRDRDRERERGLEREQPQHNYQGAGVFMDQHPEPPEKVFYKTKLCEKFEAGGRCAYEGGCTFAHGQAELRPPLHHVPPGHIIKRRTPPPPPPSLPPPPSAADAPHGEYYGKVCFEFRDRGTCHFGERCSYAHASAAAVAGTRSSSPCTCAWRPIVPGSRGSRSDLPRLRVLAQRCATLGGQGRWSTR